MSLPEPEVLTPQCAKCRNLLDFFLEATHEVIMLHERHLLAVVSGDLEPHRFDLLIHAANEKKLNAKYAYIEHRESHGSSLSKIDETD